MYYLCIGQRRKPRAAAGFLLFFGPFRGSQRASSRPTAGYVGKTKCLVVLRKSFVIFSKCFPLKTTKPRDCYRRLKTLKFGPAYLWKTTPRKATAGGARTAPPRPLAAGTKKHRQRRSIRPNGLPENENPPLQNPSPSTENTIAAAPRPQKRSKKVRKGFALQKPLRNFAQKIR